MGHADSKEKPHVAVVNMMWCAEISLVAIAINLDVLKKMEGQEQLKQHLLANLGRVRFSQPLCA